MKQLLFPDLSFATIHWVQKWNRKCGFSSHIYFGYKLLVNQKVLLKNQWIMMIESIFNEQSEPESSHLVRQQEANVLYH